MQLLPERSPLSPLDDFSLILLSVLEPDIPRFVVCRAVRLIFETVRPKPAQPQVHVLLKEGHISSDHVKAWAFASDLAIAIEHLPTLDATAVIEKIQEVKKEFDGLYATFLVDIKREGWDVESSALVSGSPRVISVVEIDATSTAIEPKKTV